MADDEARTATKESADAKQQEPAGGQTGTDQETGDTVTEKQALHEGGTGDGQVTPEGPGSTPAGERAEISNFEIVNHYFNRAAERIGLRDDVAAVLRSAYREVQVQIPVTRTDDRIHVYTGYRVQHNGARGPYKGGVRFHPGGRSRRGPRARVADDLEDRDRRHPLRRREGRRQLPRRRA